MLNPEMLEMHNKYIDDMVSKHSDDIDFYFTQGFKLGLLIGIECMEE